MFSSSFFAGLRGSFPNYFTLATKPLSCHCLSPVSRPCNPTVIRSQTCSEAHPQPSPKPYSCSLVYSIIPYHTATGVCNTNRHETMICGARGWVVFARHSIVGSSKHVKKASQTCPAGICHALSIRSQHRGVSLNSENWDEPTPMACARIAGTGEPERARPFYAPKSRCYAARFRRLQRCTGR